MYEGNTAVSDLRIVHHWYILPLGT